MSSQPPPQPPTPVSAVAEVTLPDPKDPMGIVKYSRALTIAEGRSDPLANPPPTPASLLLRSIVTRRHWEGPHSHEAVCKELA